MTPKIFAAPNRFIMGKDILNEMGTYISTLGKNAYIIGGNTALEKTQATIDKTLSENGVNIATIEKGIKMCTHSQIEKLVEIGESITPDIVVAVGGGVVADTSKAVAFKLHVPVVTVPTVCSSNADASSVAVIYTEEHEIQEYLFFPTNPSLVVVDTKIIANAPPHYLVVGMGDTLAAKFEAEACSKSKAPSRITKGVGTETAVSLAIKSFDILMNNGMKAKKSVEEGILNESVEAVIEAIKLLSVFGFESVGVAAAHALHNGLTSLKKINKFHGEKVAYCTLVQMMLENRTQKEVEMVLKWCYNIGLPITTAQLAKLSDEELKVACERACSPEDTMHKMPFKITPKKVYEALRRTNLLGQQMLEKETINFKIIEE